jgi:DNA polymerase/3'-5' exonuclease PolX
MSEHEQPHDGGDGLPHFHVRLGRNGNGHPMGMTPPAAPFRDLLERPAAIKAARAFVDAIEDATTQLVVAGSLRRRLAMVKDIEVVAVPKHEAVQLPAEGLFAGDPALPQGTEQLDLLHLRLTAMLRDGEVAKRLDKNDLPRWGPRLKYLWINGATETDVPVAVDLFSPDENSFGWILLLRTGPAAFSRQLVQPVGKKTSDGRPGLRPSHIVPLDGGLAEQTSHYRIKTPTERSVFELFNLPYREPWERT